MSEIYVRIVDASNSGYIIEDINGNRISVTKKQIALALKEHKIYSDNIALCYKTNRVERILLDSNNEYIGKEFGNWKVLAITETNRLYCICNKCNETRIIDIEHIKNGVKCTCNRRKPRNNLVGKQFGEWTVLEYTGDGTWKCQCSCENKTIHNVKTNALITGKSKSCGCISNKKADLKGKVINSWEVLGYVGDRMWRCKCSCGRIKDVHAYTLTHNLSTNCGNGIHMLSKFGETSPQKFDKPREQWQIDTLTNRDMLKEFMEKSDYKSSKYLAEKLGVTRCTLLLKVHEHNLESYINLNPSQSFMETELVNFIKSIYSGEIIQNSRKILGNKKELDIYIPEAKLAIEVNGNYWHSALYKDSQYHYNKFNACRKLGIRLIHIYEYEYCNSVKINIVHDIIRRALNRTTEVIDAKDTVVKEVDIKDEKDFLENNSIQGYVKSQKAYGLYIDNELKQLISVESDANENKCNLVILRICYLIDTSVIGGTEKLYDEIIKNFNNVDTVTYYCNNDKFSAKTYLSREFNFIGESEPEYVWLNLHKNIIISKNQANKLGLDNRDKIDIELPEYSKIYNSGCSIYERKVIK